MIISPEQCKGARAMLGLSRQRLAALSGVAQRTLTDFERGARRPYDRTLSDIRDALGRAGIAFIDEDGGGPGVRSKKPSGE